MSAPVIFNGKFSKLLTSRGLIRSDGGILEYDGPKNYIANSHFEQGVSGWSLLTTTLTSGLPTGSVTLSAASLSALATTSTNPLAGSQSLQVAAGTAWSAGQGIISSAFTVDRKDLGKVLTFKFYYEAITGTSLINWSGTLGSQSLGVYIYDVTASAWVQPAGFLGMNQGTGQGYVTGTFQTSVTAGQQYQIALIALQAPTAGAISLNIDEVYLGPQTAPLGAVATDWNAVPWTPTGSWSTNTTYTGKWKREGDVFWGQVKLALAGAPTSASLTVNLPSGLTIDTAKLNSTSAPHNRIGMGGGIAAGGGALFWVGYNSTTSVAVSYQSSTSGGQTAVTQATPGTFANGDEIDILFQVPISGWSSNVQMSNDTDTRVVAMQVNQASPTATITSSFSNIKFTAAPTQDTSGGYSTSTGKYTCSVSGHYRCSASLNVVGTYSSGQGLNLAIYKNGSEAFECIGIAPAMTAASMVSLLTGTVYCNAGDTLELQAKTGASSTSIGANSFNNYLYIERLSGPSVIAASESVSCSYTSSVTSVPNTTFTTVVYPTKEWDSHNAYSTSTGLFSVPVSGKFMVIAGIEFASSVAAQLLYVYKNGSSYKRIFQNQSASQSVSQGSAMVACNAGDTLSVVVYQAQGSTVAMTGSANDTYVSIVRVGN